jgi:delta 1-pyrroline-5-carboxylate dehydrogenase
VPIRPAHTRLGRRVPDLQLLQRAPGSIADLIEILDRRLAEEQRPEERLRMLREATNQITRTANDAIQAYRRARAAVSAELEMPDGDWPHARKMSAQLDLARADVLKALEQTSHRYSWAEPWAKGEVGTANGGSLPAASPARAQAAVPDR